MNNSEHDGPMTNVAFDEVGYWSEVKQDFVQLYSEEYTKILRAQRNLRFSYIEGFSSSGVQVRKGTSEFSFGSAIRAITIEPPFDEYHFVDIDRAKLDTLKKVIGDTGCF
jgi:three-Cys-motif partner protein